MQQQYKYNQSQQITKKHNQNHPNGIYPTKMGTDNNGLIGNSAARNGDFNSLQRQYQQSKRLFTGLDEDFDANSTASIRAPSATFQHHDNYHHNNNRCLSIFLSECLGTLVFVYLGQLAITSFELIGTQNDTISRQSGTILARSLALLFATMLTLKISGAHLNPAYTLAWSFFNYDTNYRRALNRILAQYVGAFIGAFILHMTYLDKLSQRHSEGLLMGKNATSRSHGNILSTGKFFSSFPPTEVTHFQLFASYLLANTHFALLAVATLDGSLLTNNSRNRLSSSSLSIQLKPIYLALSYGLILAAFSANGGPVLNPAQDFSTRLYMLLTGWGWTAFNLYNGHYWWLCGIVAPHIGFIIGFGIYKLIFKLQTN